ncbi:GL20972 [Drosophila persimilis]|uniref:GL20972 n=1 Tax=Drosophila persimilis TaxID=7234 RepID=B4HCE8_DROPE|nr:GL20972 [Drosophila persimilis]
MYIYTITKNGYSYATGYPALHNFYIIPYFQINLRLILVSGKTKEFIFNPSDSAGDIAQTVFDNWPTACTLSEMRRVFKEWLEQHGENAQYADALEGWEMKAGRVSPSAQMEDGPDPYERLTLPASAERATDFRLLWERKWAGRSCEIFL